MHNWRMEELAAGAGERVLLFTDIALDFCTECYVRKHKWISILIHKFHLRNFTEVLDEAK